MDHEQKPIVFEHDHDEPAPLGRISVVFLILAGLTLMQIMTGFSDLGALKIWINLGIACTQAVVLTLFFMELRYADKLTWLVACSAVFWTFLMFLFIITDHVTRHYYAY